MAKHLASTLDISFFERELQANLSASSHSAHAALAHGGCVFFAVAGTLFNSLP